MTAPPWGHKPPRVDDSEQHWNDPPPELSAHCQYWLQRHREGTWHPNRLIRRQGYHAAAEQLGIWIWEYRNVIQRLFDEEAVPAAPTSDLLDHSDF